MPSVARWRRILGQRSLSAFRYRPGDSLAALGMTATRASSALYRDATGIWQTANTNVLRDAHWQYDTLLGRSVRTLLREGAGTNSALGACSFADNTYWGGSGSFTLAAATSAIAGQTARKHTSTGAWGARTQTLGIFVNGQTDCFGVMLEQGDATQSELDIRDGTATAYLTTARLTWATLSAAVTGGAGTTGFINLGTGPNGGTLGIFWIAGTGTGAGTGAAGNSRRVELYPASGAGQFTYVHHAQFEAATSYPSSPIVTVASAVTRAADLISVAWPYAPQSCTAYVDAYDLMSGAGISTTLFLGTAGVTKPYAQLYRLTGVYTALWNATAGQSNSTAAAGPSLGNRLESRVVYAVSGGNVTSQLGQSINAAAEAVAAAGTARALEAAYPAPTKLYIGDTGTGSGGANLAIRSICIVLGSEQSMATCRQIAGT